MQDLLRKLNRTDQRRVAVLGAPPEVEPILAAWASELDVARELSAREGFVLVFVRFREEIVDLAPRVAAALADDALNWWAYPKRSSKRYTSDVGRDDSWRPLGALGYEAVRQVAVDADWSALRFRAVEHIQTITRDVSRTLSAEGRRRAGRGESL